MILRRLARAVATKVLRVVGRALVADGLVVGVSASEASAGSVVPSTRLSAMAVR